jgi:hypothetical protein
MRSTDKQQAYIGLTTVVVILWAAVTIGVAYTSLIQVSGWWGVPIGAFALVAFFFLGGAFWVACIDESVEGVEWFWWLLAILATPVLVTQGAMLMRDHGLIASGNFVFACRFGIAFTGLIIAVIVRLLWDKPDVFGDSSYDEI